MSNPTQTDLITNLIPFSEGLWVNRLRTFMRDTAELNVLDGAQESTDVQLHHAILDALDEINYQIEPVLSTMYTMSSLTSNAFPWGILRMGAALNVLVSAGILNARNTLTYNDAGGITIRDMDKHGRYVNYYNVLVNKYMRGAMAFKRSQNITNCYGGNASEYGDLP